MTLLLRGPKVMKVIVVSRLRSDSWDRANHNPPRKRWIHDERKPATFVRHINPGIGHHGGSEC